MEGTYQDTRNLRFYIVSKIHMLPLQNQQAGEVVSREIDPPPFSEISFHEDGAYLVTKEDNSVIYEILFQDCSIKAHKVSNLTCLLDKDLYFTET